MKAIIKVIIKRLGLGILTLLIITMVIFLGVEALPGDLAQAVLGQQATPESLAAIRKELGLERPAHVRYLEWLNNALRFDFGNSLTNKRPISDLIGWRFGNTIFLALSAATIVVPLSLFLGILSALYRDTTLDRTVSVGSLSAISLPEFFVAYLLIYIFAVKMPVFPGIVSLEEDMEFWQKIYNIMLPCLTLTLLITAYMMRMTRAAIISVLTSGYIEMARLKGMNSRRVILVHAFPNALAPIINVVVICLAYLVVGVVVVEVVFVYPGLGQLLVDSVSKRDIPVVQACVLIFSITYILLNLTADILSIISNPKLLHPRGGESL